MVDSIDRFKQSLDNRNIKRQTGASREWLRVNMRKLGHARGHSLAKELENDTQNYKNKLTIGNMYMFVYDPKGKVELPYYDMFPLIFVVNTYRDGMLGINLHYLSPKLRGELFATLIRLRTDNQYDARTKLKIEWEILKAFSKSDLVKPIVKKYLYSHLKSKFVKVPSDEWEIVTFLPTEMFQKETRRTVWDESKDISNR